MLIRKREGNLEEYQHSKIFNAVNKAFTSMDYDVDDETIEDMIADIILYDEISVEEIQNQIESTFKDWGFPEVAEDFKLYREKRAATRAERRRLYKDIEIKLKATNTQNQNANVDEQAFGGRIGEASRVVTKEYALNYCMSKMARENHINNEIYIHDLDSYAVGMHNCLTIPIDDLLANGFTVKNSDIRPAGSVSTALQLIAVIFQTQSLEQFGGVSISHADWSLVPYVRKSFWKHFDKHLYRLSEEHPVIDYKAPIITELNKSQSLFWNTAAKWAYDDLKQEVHQGVEALYHNLNSLLSRSGNQLPFSSINYGTCTLPEGRLIIEELLKCSIEGIGKYHRTSIFPCGIFQCMIGVNRKPGDPNYDLFKLALESTAKRLYPNYANVDWSINEGYDKNDPRTYVSSMGCRTYNGYDINGLGQLKDGRGNIAPVTIIMPTLAMKAISSIHKDDDTPKEREEIFLYILDKKIHEAKDMLIERFNWICSQSPDSAKFMYENNTMAGYIPEEGIRSALKHGTLAVG